MLLEPRSLEERRERRSFALLINELAEDLSETAQDRENDICAMSDVIGA